MAQLASLSLRELASEPAATPVVPAANESPAAPVQPAIAPAIVPPQTPEPPTDLNDDAEPSAEVLASLGDPGKRALQAERDKRKAANAKLTELQAEIDRLKATPAPTPTPAAVPPGQTPAPAAATPSVVPTELARCETFEQVDACRSHAAELAATAMELNTVLATSGLEAAQAQLKANGVETFRGVPVDNLTPEQLAAGLSATWKAATQTQAAADQQKAVIAGQRQSFGQAVNLLPGLKDPKSVQAQTFDAIVAANPQIKQLGPNWPLLVARQMLGMEAERLRTSPPPVAPVPVLTPAPVAALAASAPSAPRTSVAHVPAATELDGIRERVNSGKATEADMSRYAAMQIQTR